MKNIRLRIGAYIIDYLIISIFSFITLFIIWLVFYPQLLEYGICPKEDQNTPFIFMTLLAFPLIPIDYILRYLQGPEKFIFDDIMSYNNLWVLHRLEWGFSKNSQQNMI
ncbi:hypothetical protein FACS1894132_13230 [Clostridia bacterium]|nr:hypothetical protein FACS1894132_13230 [Clostridia bacterium]